MLSALRCLLLAAVLVPGASLTPASAAAASPWWHLGAAWRPSDLSAPGGEAELALSALNLGDAPAGGTAGPIVLVDTLPPGVSALHASGISGTLGMGAVAVDCVIQAERTVSCVHEGALAPYDQIEIRIRVELQPGEEWAGRENRFEVSGGGPRRRASKGNLSPTSGGAALGIVDFEIRPEGDDGSVEDQAGSHPFQVTTTVTFTQTAEALPTALPKDLRLRLPPGLLATLTPYPAVPQARFFEKECPLESVVGVGSFTVNNPALLSRHPGGADLQPRTVAG